MSKRLVEYLAPPPLGDRFYSGFVPSFDRLVDFADAIVGGRTWPADLAPEMAEAFQRACALYLHFACTNPTDGASDLVRSAAASRKVITAAMRARRAEARRTISSVTPDWGKEIEANGALFSRCLLSVTTFGPRRKKGAPVKYSEKALAISVRTILEEAHRRAKDNKPLGDWTGTVAKKDVNPDAQNTPSFSAAVTMLLLREVDPDHFSMLLAQRKYTDADHLFVLARSLFQGVEKLKAEDAEK